MRPQFLATAILAASTVAFSQPSPTTPPQRGTWAFVETLPTGTKIHLKFFRGSKTDCRVRSVDDNTLTCDNAAVFQRDTIAQIRSNHRLRSSIVAYPIGYGIATGVTYAVTRNNSCRDSLGCAIALSVVDLGILVATPIIGHFTDFTATTLYRADAPPAATKP